MTQRGVLRTINRTASFTLIAATTVIAAGCATQSMDHNKSMARRGFEEAWSLGELGVADEVYHPDFTYRVNGTTQLGLQRYKQFITDYRAAMPDLDFDLKKVLAEGDEVVVYWEAKGTQTGQLGAMPSSGRVAVVEGISVLEFENGQAISEWTTWDEHGFFEQLGARY